MKEPILSKEKASKRVAKAANRPIPALPNQTDAPPPHSYVEHLINHSGAQALGYGMLPRDYQGIRLVMNSGGGAK